MTGSELIAEERQRQISKEGYDACHDDEHDQSELALAACSYASPYPLLFKKPHLERDVWADTWIWSSCDDKRAKHSRIRQLAIAGALIAAEIDRLQRKDNP